MLNYLDVADIFFWEKLYSSKGKEILANLYKTKTQCGCTEYIQEWKGLFPYR